MSTSVNHGKHTHLLQMLMHMSCTTVIYLEAKCPCLIGAGTLFWRVKQVEIVDIQRLLTLPTPNLSHPTACLGRLLCGCGCKCQTGSVASLGFFMWMCHAWKTETKVPRRKTCIWSICLVWGNEKTDSSSWHESHATYLRRKIETKCTGASKISSTFRGSYSRLVLDLAVNVVRRSKVGLCKVYFLL